MHPIYSRTSWNTCVSERNASPHTVRCYEDDLVQFEGYLIEAMGEGADPTRPTRGGSGRTRPG